MKKTKKILIFMVCVVFCLSMFVGCGGGEEEASSGDVITIKIASDETDDTPCSKATQVFKELVEENSDGKMVVEYYGESAMGDEREIAESVNMGNLEMGIIAGCMLATYDEDWYAVDMPFVWKDREQMYSLLDGEVGQILKDGLAEKSNIQVLDFADGSFKVLLSAGKEVRTVDDMKNMKFRAQESQMNMSIYDAWNSTAVPMGMSEVYTALQQGTVDGVDTSPLYQVTQKFHEIGKSFTMTNHQSLLMTSIINKDFLASLDEDMQQIIIDASHEAYAVQEREMVVDDENAACEEMEKAGCKQIELTDEELDTFKAASKDVYEEYRSKVDPKIYELMGL